MNDFAQGERTGTDELFDRDRIAGVDNVNRQPRLTKFGIDDRENVSVVNDQLFQLLEGFGRQWAPKRNRPS